MTVVYGLEIDFYALTLINEKSPPNIIKGQDMQDSLRKEKRKEGKVIT